MKQVVNLYEIHSRVLLLRVVLENVSIIQCTRGKIDSFSIGSLANYGDQSVQERIRSEIKNPRSYLDIQNGASICCMACSKTP